MLQPLSVAKFLDEIWGATHYHVQRACAGYFDGLLPGSFAVEELLAHVAPEPSAVRLVRRGEDKDPDTYRRADGSLDLAAVRDGFADGYTIVVDNLERYVRTISSLSHAVEVELNFPTQVNGYITPPGSTGFVAHYDPHDVLVLQIRGSKTWHVSADAAVPPHEILRRKGTPAAGLSLPTSLRLEVGDVLYLPRGHVHAAETTAEPSLHVTVGLHAPTALTLVTAVLRALSLRDERLHVRLPARHLDDDGVRAGLGDLMRDVAEAIEDPGAVAEGLDALADVLVRRGRCPPVGPASHAAGIDGRTRVVRYQPLYSRVVSAAGGVALQFAQLMITVSPDHDAALRFVSGCTEPFLVGDLPGLSAAQQMELARTLISTGFLARLPDG
ncbi:cupin domain-containing protein [Mycobacterium sp.]|uniref:cupin domain-containing protein n=1 Tax=Mycobacterium sp. TaxID=1785 RepID=UPI0031E2D23B